MKTEYEKRIKMKRNLNEFFKRDINEIRNELLLLNGIGPETADSIILYAGGMPIFVVDAYTKRLCRRIPFDTKLSYSEIQNYFQKELSKVYKSDELTKIYNDIEKLNAAIVGRLRAAGKADSAVNALVHLDIFAKLLTPGLEESLNSLHHLISPFLATHKKCR